MTMESTSLLGMKAFVVLYDEDLSSEPLGVINIDNTVLKRLNEAWLAIVIHKKDGQCYAYLISRGKIVDQKEVGHIYLYKTIEAVLKRDLENVVRCVDYE